MPKYDDPPNTCPDIDAWQKDLRDLADRLEELREANVKIRDWGHDKADELQDAKDEIDSLRSQLQAMTEERDAFEKDARELGEENTRLESRVLELEAFKRTYEDAQKTSEYE